MRISADIAKDGAVTLVLDSDAAAKLSTGFFQLIGLVQNMAGVLDRIARLPVVGIKWQKKGARRGKAKRARA